MGWFKLQPCDVVEMEIGRIRDEIGERKGEHDWGAG